MFDPKWIRENPGVLDKGLARRGLPPASANLLAIDEKRREVIGKLQALQEKRNAVSKEIGEAKKAKDEARASKLMAEVAALKNDVPALEERQREIDKEFEDALAQIPNIPFDDVPNGKDEKDNVELRRVGEAPKLPFKPKLHFEIGEALGLMDFEAAAKLSGARFVVLKGALARLERAIGQLFLDTHTGEHGYTEISPPILVRDEVMFGTAQLPKFAEDQFFAGTVGAVSEFREKAVTATLDAINELREQGKLNEVQAPRIIANAVRFSEVGPQKTERWLIPTAEVPLTNLVRESIVEESALPMRLTACTPCFRAEAGAAGKDTRGMIRQHQFTKVELVSITTPEQSNAEHERMLTSAEAVLKKLGLHYRVVTLCTGDMGFAAGKTYDIEVWLPGENTFREISSCSNCGEFQARRMQARYRPKDSKQVRHVHTLNGSGVAVGRALIAVLENYQQADGTVLVPEALQPYMGGMKKIEKAK
ncbi:MAG TPA: serine--tRNA ligase [Xanthobacteraceae bacterium]|nr:serine--tRNA ligase [Xanthobacteraceae bacterium]